MADRPNLLHRILGTRSAGAGRANSPHAPYPVQAKAYVDTGTGVAFVGPDSSRLVLLDGALEEPDHLTKQTAFAISAYCYTAARFRASRLAEPPLLVERETDEGNEWDRTHPLVPFLTVPREDLEMGELLERTQLYQDLTGAAIWVLTTNNVGRVLSATPFSALEFRVIREGALIYGRYEYRDATGTWIPVGRDQVVHFRSVNPLSWTESRSLVDVALGQLDTGHQVQVMVRRFLSSAMFPASLITYDPEWKPTQKEFDTWKDKILAWHSGPANAGKPLVVDGKTTMTKTDRGMADLLPAEVLDRVEATVGAVFGVPPVVLGWLAGLKNSPWSQFSEARRAAYEDTIEPLWRKTAGKLTRALVSADEQARGIVIRFDTASVRALQDDEEGKARISVLNQDTWTVNERRLFTGMEPLPPGDPRGDMIVGLPTASDPGTDPGADDGDAADEPDPADAADPNDDDPAKAADARKVIWALFDASTKAGEASYERVVFAHLQGLKRDVAAAARIAYTRAAKAAGTSERKAAPDPKKVRDSFQLLLTEILDQDRPLLAAKTYPLILNTGTAGVKRVALRLGLSFGVLEPGLLKYAREESRFLAKVMGETTGAAVSAALQAGLNAGETIGPLAKRLESLPAFDRTRAKLVARTETTRAWNGAQRRSLQQYDAASETQRVLKVWLSSRDLRVREEHAQGTGLDGEEQPIGKAFSNGLQEPGEPNCRCTLTYRLVSI